jgi:cob(I)alamin adenosyltransferase
MAAPPPKSSLYTRTGDTGSSSLFSGERRSKDDAVFAALGDVDELNSMVGLAREFCSEAGVGLDDQLAYIQSRLLDCGSAVATPRAAASASAAARTAFPPDAVATLEGWLDAHDAQLPPLTAFILPSGGKAAASLHAARAVCRRAERAVVPLSFSRHDCESSVAVFLNRLSDYLFVAARTAVRASPASARPGHSLCCIVTPISGC